MALGTWARHSEGGVLLPEMGWGFTHCCVKPRSLKATLVEKHVKNEVLAKLKHLGKHHLGQPGKELLELVWALTAMA